MRKIRKDLIHIENVNVVKSYIKHRDTWNGRIFLPSSIPGGIYDIILILKNKKNESKPIGNIIPNNPKHLIIKKGNKKFYLCNQKCNISEEKCASNKKKVTCKNCLRRINENRLS